MFCVTPDPLRNPLCSFFVGADFRKGNSVNERFGKDFHRKGNSVKRFGPFTEPPDSENSKVAVLIPFPKIGSHLCLSQRVSTCINKRLPRDYLRLVRLLHETFWPLRAGETLFGISDMGSTKIVFAMGVCIGDVGSILNLCIGFSNGRVFIQSWR